MVVIGSERVLQSADVSPGPPQEIPGLTDVTIPRRLGPKRANKIRKLFNLGKEDDVRQYVLKRPLPAKEGKENAKQRFKSPKIQRLITPVRLQVRRRRPAAAAHVQGRRRRWARDAERCQFGTAPAPGSTPAPAPHIRNPNHGESTWKNMSQLDTPWFCIGVNNQPWPNDAIQVLLCFGLIWHLLCDRRLLFLTAPAPNKMPQLLQFRVKCPVSGAARLRFRIPSLSDSLFLRFRFAVQLGLFSNAPAVGQSGTAPVTVEVGIRLDHTDFGHWMTPQTVKQYGEYSESAEGAMPRYTAAELVAAPNGWVPKVPTNQVLRPGGSDSMQDRVHRPRSGRYLENRLCCFMLGLRSLFALLSDKLRQVCFQYGTGLLVPSRIVSLGGSDANWGRVLCADSRKDSRETAGWRVGAKWPWQSARP